MMKLVFDTNIIHEDFHLYGGRITKLCGAAEKLGYDLMIPDVVVDETVNQYRKKLLDNYSGYAGVMKLVARTQGADDKLGKDAFISDKVKEYEAYLRKRLTELKIQVIPYPTVDVKALVSKDLNVKKPFKETKEGNIGYRDAIIWESIKTICKPPKELIEDHQIEFLTENTRDFAGPDSALHPELVAEVKEAGFAENVVALIPNVNEFFKNRIDPELEELEQIKEELIKTGKFSRFDVNEETSRVLDKDYITEIISDSDFDSGQRYYLPGYMEDPTINYINDPAIEDITVRRLSDHTALIEVQARVTVEMDFFVYKPDYYIYEDERRFSINDENWNEYYMWCEGTVDVCTYLSFRTTSKLGKILSVEVQVTEVEV